MCIYVLLIMKAREKLMNKYERVYNWTMNELVEDAQREYGIQSK